MLRAFTLSTIASRAMAYLLKCLRNLVCVMVVFFCPLAIADIAATYYDQNGSQRAYFTGTEVTRVDTNINFNWGTGAPVTGVGNDDFSVRWIGEFEVPTSGDYIFTTLSDDGIRLYVDDNLVIDNWTDHAQTYDTASVAGLVAGQRYSIQMDFYERSGNARAELLWEGPGFSREVIPASYLFLLDPTPPVATSASSPCFDGTILLTFDKEITQASAENLANYSVADGVVLVGATLSSTETAVTLEYFAGDGTPFNLTLNNIESVAGATMSVSQTIEVSGAANGLQGTYFDQNNTSGQFFTGSEIVVIDPVIDFDWDTAAPMPGIGADFFSVRWEGELLAPSDGDYTFYTLSDDGVRLSLDNNLIIDNWTTHAVTSNSSAVQTLVGGQSYPIQMEFYERAIHAVAVLEWQGPGFSREVIPTTQLFNSCSVANPAVVAEYRLDERSWRGGVDEVLDESGNALHGRAINLDSLPSTSDSASAITGNPGTCRYGDFSGTSDGYIQVDDPGTASLLDFPTAYSLTAWIYPRALPSGSDLSTIVSKDENYEFHLNSSGQVRWWWGDQSRALTGTSSLGLNEWHHIAITNTSGQQVIYINGSPDATSTLSTGITVNNDPLLIGNDVVGGDRRFDGLIDEVRLYDSVLTASNVANVMAETHVCEVPTIEHFAVSHSGSGITCEAESVTIIAHDTGEIPTDADGVTIQVRATSNTAGWNASDSNWTLESGGGSLVSTGPGVVEYTFTTGETAVILGLGNTSVADIDIDVVDTSDSNISDNDGVSEDPVLSFSASGLRFYNDLNGDGDADGTDPISGPFISGVTSSGFVLKAVETNTETGACEGRLLGDQTVNFAYECINPMSCVRDQDMLIGSSAIQENDSGSVADFNALNLTFDSEGEAPLTLNYFDVGIVSLHASLSLAASGSDPAVTLSGSSAEFAVVPADLVITTIETLSGESNLGTTTTGAGFVTAGTPFRVVIEARNANNGLTPNFGQEIAPELPKLNIASLVMPSGGTLPALNSAASFSVLPTEGRFENTSVNWAEAGTITLQVDINDGDYLGAGNIVGAVSENVGRFYPAYLQLDSASIIAGCATGGFSYMSDQSFTYQPFDLAYSVSAQGDGSGKLDNYDAALGYPVVTSMISYSEDNNDGVDLSARSMLASSVWEGGEWDVDASGAFRRAIVDGNEFPDGPYTALQFGISAGSNVDDVDFMSAAKLMNSTTSGNCSTSTNCNAVPIGSTQNVVFGRLVGVSRHGSEAASLAVPLTLEYWDGGVFDLNTADDCTRILMSDTQFDGASLSLDSNRTVSIASGTTTGSFTDYSAGVSFGFISGDAELNFSAPGAGNTGQFFIDIDLLNTPWLTSDWNQDGDSANDTALPSIEINFGGYRGHDRIIYWNEVFKY